ncbi:MAG: serine/threonine-protein kinase, partial [Planctomycetota bacterium]
GGMGRVYLAEQTDPVKRRVALKVIKTDTPTKEVLARFEAERQALALMDHHNIARVFDAGVTKRGRPYFVMELVKGVPITRYCDKNRLSPDERLELFIQTCRAIQHAHAKGIVHRDIKPSNVLVALEDGKPTVKVIDFGLAKALNETTQLTDHTLFTRYGQVVGTLAYMSPEQAEMNSLDIDTRTDVYSLGVVFYELLTGSTPITADEIRREAFDRILALIRESDPPRPSARLSDSGEEISGISEQRRTEPRRLSLILKGDLDWIAIKALEKDRNRRYETPVALADDVQRFLDSEAITARPPSLGYQFQKSFRKYRARYVAACTIAGLLIAGLAGTGTQWYRAIVAEGVAKQETERTKDALKEVETQRDLATENEQLAKRNEERATAKAVEATEQRNRANDSAAAAKFQLANGRWDAGQAEQARRILHEIPADYRDNFEWNLCNRKFLGSDMTFYGHVREVFSMDYSPDGKYIVSGGLDPWLKLWDATTGEEVATLAGHTAAIFGVRFSPDGKYIASYDANHLIKLWDFSDLSREVATLEGHTDTIVGVCFSPDGKLLASHGADKQIKLWSIETRREFQTLSGHSDYINRVRFRQDGKQLASSSRDGTLRLWDSSSGALVQTINRINPRKPSLPCYDFDWSPDGKI